MFQSMILLAVNFRIRFRLYQDLELVLHMFEFCSAGPFLFVFLFFIIIFLLSLPSISTIYLVVSMQPLGIPRWLSGKEFACQCWRRRRRGFNSWVGKISWRRKCQRTPVFLPGEFHGQKILASYSLCSCKESDTTQQVNSNNNNKWNLQWPQFRIRFQESFQDSNPSIALGQERGPGQEYCLVLSLSLGGDVCHCILFKIVAAF